MALKIASDFDSFGEYDEEENDWDDDMDSFEDDSIDDESEDDDFEDEELEEEDDDFVKSVRFANIDDFDDEDYDEGEEPDFDNF